MTLEEETFAAKKYTHNLFAELLIEEYPPGLFHYWEILIPQCQV